MLYTHGLDFLCNENSEFYKLGFVETICTVGRGLAPAAGFDVY